jgi:GH24 family phage-related lysozyme (muramidase)
MVMVVQNTTAGAMIIKVYTVGERFWKKMTFFRLINQRERKK